VLPLLISLWPWRGDDLFEIDQLSVDHVLVVQLLEDFNLLDDRDRELTTLSLVVHANLLDCHISFLSVSFAMNTCR